MDNFLCENNRTREKLSKVIIIIIFYFFRFFTYWLPLLLIEILILQIYLTITYLYPWAISRLDAEYLVRRWWKVRLYDTNEKMNTQRLKSIEAATATVQGRTGKPKKFSAEMMSKKNQEGVDGNEDDDYISEEDSDIDIDEALVDIVNNKKECCPLMSKKKSADADNHHQSMTIYADSKINPCGIWMRYFPYGSCLSKKAKKCR
jgi:hypothetical protein